MTYSITQLIEAGHAFSPADFLFFWGHQPTKDGSIGKSCLSQWWVSEFVEDGVCYTTAEQYMMAGKARLFEDDDTLQRILNESIPKEIKALGRLVRNFDAAVWDQRKYAIVQRANYLKFSQNKALETFLLSTENRIIVEASPRDRIWGIGMSEKNENAVIPANWRGHNLLGFALMETRDQLREQH